MQDIDHTDERAHNAWLADRLAEGWVHDNHRDDLKKRHPCILPWAELPAEYREKRAPVAPPPNARGTAFDQQVAKMRPDWNVLEPFGHEHDPKPGAATEKRTNQPVVAPVLEPTPELIEAVSAPE